LAALILSDTVVDVLRREVRRMAREVKIDGEQIRSALMADVLKREVIEGAKAEAARRQVVRAASRTLRATKEGENSPPSPEGTKAVSPVSKPPGELNESKK
jgi:ParB-like chromosome segregation protein Spo0J